MGFLVNVQCPTEERLKMRLDITHLQNHMDFVYELQDLITSINESYSKGARPRSCTVRYEKVKSADGVKRRKVLEFSPFPSPIINGVKEARSKLYEALNRNCLVLASEKVGKQERRLYFLPLGRHGALASEVDRINEKLSSIQGKIDEFVGSEGARRIESLLSTVGGEVKICGEVGRASVVPIPFALSRDFISEFIEEARESLREVEAEKERAMKRLKEELEEQRVKMIGELEGALRKKVLEAIEAIEEASKEKRATKELVDAVESAANLASSMGLGIAPSLKEAAESLKRKDPPSNVAGRLAISLGAPLEEAKEKMKREPLLSVW